MTCSFDGCDRPTKSRWDTLCNAHTKQKAEGKELTPIKPIGQPQPPAPKPVKEPKPELDLTKFTKRGKPRVKVRKDCTVCGEPAVAKQLCRRHYDEQYRAQRRTKG